MRKQATCCSVLRLLRFENRGRTRFLTWALQHANCWSCEAGKLACVFSPLCAPCRAVPRMVRPEGIRDFSFPLRSAQFFTFSGVLFGTKALVTVCFWHTNRIMAWAWMLWSPQALGTRTLSWFGHGCSGHRMILEQEWNYALGMDALVTVCSWNTNGYYAFGMAALATVCSWNTNVIMVWAWTLGSPYALGTRTLLWFGHGCCGHRMLLEHERYYAFGMAAVVTVCSWNTNVIMVWAWMLWLPYALRTRMLPGSGSWRRVCLNRGRSHGPFASPGNEARQQMLLTTDNIPAHAQGAAGY